ncbi:F-box protein CPR1 [Linum grandiflorum]
MANILLRLRAKDLVNCKRVTKLWMSIIDDPNFIGSQLECALSTNSNSAIFLQESPSDDYSLLAYGFGYDKSSDDYKVVRIVETKQGGTTGYSYRAQVCGVRSKCFSSIPLPITDNWNWCCLTRNYMGVFSDGTLHWCAAVGNRTVEYVIHAFDLVSNTYRQLRWPVSNFGDQVCRLNLGIVDRRLCVCGVFKDQSEIGIFVMEEYWNSKSWNMIYSIQNVDQRYSSPYDVVNCVGNNGDKILLVINWERYVWFDPTTTIMVDMDLRRNSPESEAIFCLESLVKIDIFKYYEEGCLQ